MGQLLNSHPELLVSNEARVLEHCLVTGKNVSSIIDALASISMSEFENGTLKYDQNFNEENTRLWQRDWTNISKNRLPKKKKIRYIGDKKQGGNSELIMNSPHVLSLIDMPFKPVTVIRNPEQVYASYLRINGDPEKSANTTITNMQFGLNFAKNNDGIISSYDKLLESPKKWADEICDDFEIERSAEWIELVTSSVVKHKKPFRLSGEHAVYFQSHPEYKSLMKLYESCADT